MNIINTKSKCQNCKEFMDRLLKEQVEKLKKENETLKDRWEKLKEFLDKDITNGEYYFKILNKMQELENDNKNGN